MTDAVFPQPQDKLRILKRIPLFASLSGEELALVAEKTRLVEFKAEETVYREGDAADAFYVVASGRLKVYTDAGGREQVLAYLHKGDSLGEISLLTGETHSASVRSQSDALVLKLEKVDFDDVINRIPSLVLYLSRVLSRRLRRKEGAAGPYAEALVIAVYGPSADAAPARFAAALAAGLARETRREAILVDLRRDGATASALLGLSEQRAPVRLEMAGLGTDVSVFEGAVQTHPSGLSVLNVGRALEGEMDERVVAPLLSYLGERFGYIVVRLPAGADQAAWKTLAQSDAIYLVSTAQAESLRQIRAFRKRLEEMIAQAAHRVHIVLDRSEPAAGDVAQQECAALLECPLSHVLPPTPTDGDLSRLLEQADAPYLRTVRRIAREVAGLLVGLALGSGAALGLAHIGVLKVLERERIPVDLISGTSMGALVAALWAVGKPAAELEALALRFRRPRDCAWMLGDFGFLALWRGFQSGDGVRRLLERDLGERTFKDTRMPLKIVAANPWTRETLVLEEGRLSDAVRTSISIPGIFYPVPHRNGWYLDGGVVSPVPVRVLRHAGAKRVIAVNVFPTTEEMTRHTEEAARRQLEREEMIAKRSFVRRVVHRIAQEAAQNFRPSVLDVIMRSMQMMEYEIAEVECLEADLTLRPTVPGSHWIELFHAPKFIARGEEIAERQLPQIQKLLTEKV